MINLLLSDELRPILGFNHALFNVLWHMRIRERTANEFSNLYFSIDHREAILPLVCLPSRTGRFGVANWLALSDWTHFLSVNWHHVSVHDLLHVSLISSLILHFGSWFTLFYYIFNSFRIFWRRINKVMANAFFALHFWSLIFGCDILITILLRMLW